MRRPPLPLSTLALFLILAVLLPATLGFDWLKRTAPEPAEDDRDTIVQVQIYLDSQWFGPGKIDGALGTFTRQAVEDYNRRHNVEAGNWYRVLKEAGKAVPEIYRSFTIPESASDHVGSVPSSRAEQAQRSYLPYRSYLEYVSERFHTDERFLTRINPDRNLSRLRPGGELLVPNVAEFRIEAIEKHLQFEDDPTLSARRLLVDTTRKTVSIFDPDGALVASFPITPGQDQFIPYGEWKCVNMVTTPEFRYDSQMLNHGERSDDFHMLPPGPNSPVGIFWAGLNKTGIGLHGTSSPETIGRSRSAGCIRLANWDAVRLSVLFRPGASVEVR